jgi:uncharacterized cupin superfamily protein
LKNNGKFLSIDRDRIEEALTKTSRQYFVGNLKLPQMIEHIADDDVEIGISYYKENNSHEAAHWHPIQKEFHYMISGRTIYTNVVTGETYEYKAGDFYAIYPEICYKQVSDAGTKILFIKTPSINDKVNWTE